MRAPYRLVGAVLVTAMPLTACASDAGSSDDTGRQTLTVLAASSLTEAFAELERTYEAEHPDVDVTLSFDSSAVLAEQVVQGNPADVLATADTTTMKTVTGAGLAEGEPEVFATNSLVIVTPPDDPGGVTGIDDLAGDVSFAVCVPEAPCGDASRRLLDLDGVDAAATTQEQNVKGVLTKVTLGEVDAGLVYRSDAVAAGDDVAVVDADNASEVVNADPITVLTSSEDPEAAAAWVDLVVGKEGQAVLKRHGFGAASG